MSRPLALLIVVAIWVAVYLPALGSLEIKGEEGRRILPAVTMLETGNYLVPQIGSEPYFRKPPLVNWLVAGAFRLTHTRNEWSARLPSVICVLAVALAFASVARQTLGASGSLIAAIVWLTNFGIIEKGRLIEIEALYVSLFALAIICWLSWWFERRDAWFTWTMPWIFLGLGLLAKGPLHLLFFYAIVVSALLGAGEVRRLWSPLHLLGVAIMLAIFAAWALPCLAAMNHGHIAQTWSRQLTGRLGASDFHLTSWLMNIPRAVGYCLPWILLVPFLKPRFASLAAAKTWRAILWGTCVSFLLVILLPSALPRYVMPLLAPAIWLLAQALCNAEFRWFGGRLVRPAWPRLTLTIAAFVSACMLIYAAAIVPTLRKHQKVRAIAQQLDAAIEPGVSLYAVDPDFQPFLFYLRSKLVYTGAVADVPYDARFVLVQPENAARVAESTQWTPRKAVEVLRPKDYRARSVVLFAIR